MHGRMRLLVLAVAVVLCAASAQPERQAAAPAPVPARKAAIPPEVVACEAGDLDRCFDAAKLLRADIPLGNQADARWKAGCQRDQREDCFRLGLLIPIEGIPWFTRSCDLGLTRGCYMLGLRIEYKDRPAAESLFRRTCDSDYAWGCLALASSIQRTAPDSDDALALLDRACTLEEPDGCLRARGMRCLRGSTSDCSPPAAKRPPGEVGGIVAEPGRSPPPPPPPPAPPSPPR
jgi:hypothetical protein